MKLEILRISSGKDSTSGILFDISNKQRKFLCYTLEDEQRDVKVWGETRIPAGEYTLSLRKEGGFHNKYRNKYGDMHKGMIHVNDVEGFEYILWHTGNTDENTAGCLLLGNSQTSNLVKKDGFIGSSVNAYKEVYPYVAAAIENAPVTVEYIDYDGNVHSNDIETVNSNDNHNVLLEKLSEISGEIQIINAILNNKRIN
tara:strand:- start:2591 stop:3187 length:597 start_codon:yes stop_codon:yes gene_type:complete